MKNIHICLLILLFFGCVNSGNFNEKINILAKPMKIINHVKNEVFSFKKIIEKIAENIGAPAIITKVLDTAVCCIE